MRAIKKGDDYMNMEKREYTILEFDTAKEEIIEPDKVHKTKNLSEYCVPFFFKMLSAN